MNIKKTIFSKRIIQKLIKEITDTRLTIFFRMQKLLKGLNSLLKIKFYSQI